MKSQMSLYISGSLTMIQHFTINMQPQIKHLPLIYQGDRHKSALMDNHIREFNTIRDPG